MQSYILDSGGVVDFGSYAEDMALKSAEPGTVRLLFAAVARAGPARRLEALVTIAGLHVGGARRAAGRVLPAGFDPLTAAPTASAAAIQSTPRLFPPCPATEACAVATRPGPPWAASLSASSAEAPTAAPAAGALPQSSGLFVPSAGVSRTADTRVPSLTSVTPAPSSSPPPSAGAPAPLGALPATAC